MKNFLGNGWGFDRLIAAISKHKDILTAVEAAKSLDIEETYILGPLLGEERENMDWIYDDGRDLYVGRNFSWIDS